MSYTQDQLARLPKWAQNEIERLSANVEYWENKYKVSVGEDEPSKGSPLVRCFERDDFYLPESVIRFDTFDVSIGVRGDSLEVFSESGAISILPQAANAFRVMGSPRIIREDG